MKKEKSRNKSQRCWERWKMEKKNKKKKKQVWNNTGFVGEKLNLYKLLYQTWGKDQGRLGFLAVFGIQFKKSTTLN